MSLLNKLGADQGYLKGGFLGFQKSGKTFTATLLACATKRRFGLKGPIAMFDTEGGSPFISPLVQQLSGGEFLGHRSRSFDDMCTLGEECLQAGVSVYLVDSMTHVWRELCESYLRQLNERLERSRKPKRTRLEFQDWSHIKGLWARWTNFYLTSPLHIIICGRAGYEYDFETNEEGKKELVKTGVKMKTEGEFGFEPSLLVEMERVQTADGKGGFEHTRRATVIGDRFGVIDAKEQEFLARRKADGSPDREAEMEAVGEFFAPHLKLLVPGAHAPVDTQAMSDAGLDEDGEGAAAKERKTRTILCEEIQGEITNKFPGQTAAEKKAKADLLFDVFGTRSWTAVEAMDSTRLRGGLAAVRATLGTGPAEGSTPFDPDPSTQAGAQA